MSEDEPEPSGTHPPAVESSTQSRPTSTIDNDGAAGRGLVVIAVKQALASAPAVEPADRNRQLGARGRATAEIVLGLSSCPTALILVVALCVRACVKATEWVHARR